MTTARYRNRINQAVISMERQADAVFVESQLDSQTFPAKSRGIGGLREYSFRDLQMSGRTDDFGVMGSESNQPYFRYAGNEPEYPSYVAHRRGDIQDTRSLMGTTYAAYMLRMMGGYDQHFMMRQLPQPGIFPVGLNAYRLEPTAASPGALAAEMETIVEPVLETSWVRISPDVDLYAEFLSNTPMDEEYGPQRVIPGVSHVYDKRIETLRGYAAEEGISVNETSVEAFRQFVEVVVHSTKALLIVMDNGNLRAVWKEDGSHLGLQFLGGQQVQYVVFKQIGLGREVNRLSGRHSFAGMVELVKESGLWPLMSA